MQNVVARISLKTIQKNAALVIDRAHVPFIAVVKDDAYGHGAVRVAFALRKKASAFAVATVDEGAELRIAGIQTPVLVFTPPLDREDAIRMRAYRLTASVTSQESLAFAREFGLDVQFAVNTGMNRYGFAPEEVLSAAREAKESLLGVTGVYSHFYMAEDERAREEQFALFTAAAEDVKLFYPNAVRHIAATGGLLAGEKYRLDAVRSGIALYGYLPKGFEGALPVEAAAKVYAAVSNSGLRVGRGAGYGFSDEEPSFYTLRAGYGDGFFRSGNLGGCNALCMDACIRAGDARLGERKLLFDNMSDYAKETGTTEYEVLVRILKGAVKYYD